MTTAPSACFAMRPVSMLSSLPPKLTPSRTNMWSPCLWPCSDENRDGSASAQARVATVTARIDCAAVQLDVADALLADPERLDYGAIAFDVFGLQIVQKTAALADQHQKTATRVMILHVGLEVLGEIRDPL